VSIDNKLNDLINSSGINSTTLDEIIAELQSGAITTNTGDAPTYAFGVAITISQIRI
jgi:hypothetical protein